MTYLIIFSIIWALSPITLAKITPNELPKTCKPEAFDEDDFCDDEIPFAFKGQVQGFSVN